MIATLHTSGLNVPQIGDGIYLPKDVAQLLELNYYKVRSLMNSLWSSKTFGAKGNRAINFYSLIEFYIYYHLREKGHSTQQIKLFHKNLSKNLNTPYPFASINVLDPKKKNKKSKNSKIWYEYKGTITRDDRINQQTISSFVTPFLKQVEFGDDNMAGRFFPLRHSLNVVVDPHHQFGLPVINGTNLQTKTIFRLYDAGESKDNICNLYDISENEVDDAIRLHTRKVA